MAGDESLTTGWPSRITARSSSALMNAGSIQDRSSQFPGDMSVRTHRTGDIVFPGKGESVIVVRCRHAARVEGFDRIHMRKDLEQVFLFPASVGIHRVGNADERTLIAKPLDGLHGRKTVRDFFGHEGSQQVPLVWS